MDNTREDLEHEDLPMGVFELPGEPAIVINGVPEVASTDEGTMVVSSSVSGGGEKCGDNTNADADLFGNGGFGRWLIGREVMKWFGDRYYTGTVTQFDKESKWYRVVYEDGDSEDLDWQELESVLLPLDISVPLRSLALKVLENHNTVDSFGGSATKAESDSGRIRRCKEKKLETVSFKTASVEFCGQVPGSIEIDRTVCLLNFVVLNSCYRHGSM